MDVRDVESSRSPAYPTSNGTKRSSSVFASPRRKKNHILPEQESGVSGGASAADTESCHHVRWLVESSICARILGPGGKRFKHMKESVKEPNLQARISPKVPDSEFRVFNCVGSAMSISRITGLFVRYIYDEPENEHSHAESCRYDLKLLVPLAYADSLVGSNAQNLREIEERSNALLSIENDCLPLSTEKCLHIFGVADAVQIAVYFTLKTMRNAEGVLGLSTKDLDHKLFDPVFGARLEFKTGRQSDHIPKSRPLLSSGAGGSTSYAVERSGASIDGAARNGGASTGSTSSVKGSANGSANGSVNFDNMAVSPAYPSRPSNSQPQAGLLMPALEEDGGVPQSVYTAYDIARDSKRTNLRQMIQIDAAHKGSDSERGFLLENIRRITSCRVEIGVKENGDHFLDEAPPGDMSLIIEGPPEENSMALLLIYRFLRKCTVRAN